MAHLLPPNASAQEIALSETTGRLSVAVEIPKLVNIATCPVALLPWLAWMLSLDEWDDNWIESVKRQLISEAYNIHSRKGTPGAIKKALLAIGYDNVIIRESRENYYNGVQNYDGLIDYGSHRTWPEFDVLVNIGYIPDALMIAKIRARIEHYKNERSGLRNLIFMNILYNGDVTYDGMYQYNGGVL